MMSEETAVVYTDGSCIGNPGPGGWAVHAEFSDGRVQELGGGDLETTNNRMELRAAIEAVRLTARCATVTVITDSSYVQRGVTGWVAGWKRNGWQTAAKQPVENRALWEELDALADGRVTWKWTRAHVGTPGNERCDAIARWFAEGVERLDRGSGGTHKKAAAGRSVTTSGMSYLSVVDGVVARHATWAECERRVRGVRGARFRKIRNEQEGREAIAAWGLPPEALDYP